MGVENRGESCLYRPVTSCFRAQTFGYIGVKNEILAVGDCNQRSRGFGPDCNPRSGLNSAVFAHKKLPGFVSGEQVDMANRGFAAGRNKRHSQRELVIVRNNAALERVGDRLAG